MTAEVFLSYARDDQLVAERIANALSADTIDVWLDRVLRSGEFFPESIDRTLKDAKAIVCVWSNASVRSDWVRAEALVGFERKVLVPLRIEPCAIPVPFNGIHALDFLNWSGDPDHPEWRALLETLSDLLGRRAIKEWARRSRPVTLAELAHIYQRYPADALSSKTADIARLQFKTDPESVPVAAEQVGTAAFAPLAHDSSGRSLYEAKRRQLEQQKLAEISLDLEEFGLAVETAHRTRRLESDLKRLFPRWNVSVEFDYWSEMYSELLAAAPEHPTDQQLRAAYDALFEEDDNGSFVHPHYGEVADGLGTGRIALRSGELSAHVWYIGSGALACELDQRWQRQIERFSPPAFADCLRTGEGVGSYFSSISLLNSWIRERFIEFCAASGIEPEEFETPRPVHATAPTNPPQADPARRSPWTTTLSTLALGTLIFVLSPRSANEIPAALASIVGALVYSALVTAQAILPTDDTKAFLIKFWLRVPLQISLFLFFIFAFISGLALVLNWLGIE